MNSNSKTTKAKAKQRKSTSPEQSPPPVSADDRVYSERTESRTQTQSQIQTQTSSQFQASQIPVGTQIVDLTFSSSPIVSPENSDADYDAEMVSLTQRTAGGTRIKQSASQQAKRWKGKERERKRLASDK
jgi:hypothetical protein